MTGRATKEGVVEEAMPQGLFRVRGVAGEVWVASLARDAKHRLVKVALGDRVDVRVMPLDPTRAQIIGKRR